MKHCLKVVLSLFLILVISSADLDKAQGAQLSKPAASLLPAPRFLKTFYSSDPEHHKISIVEQSIMASGDRDYFLVDDNSLYSNSRCDMWVTDGSADGTQFVSYFVTYNDCPQMPQYYQEYQDYLPFGEHSLLFDKYDYPTGLFITDGIITTNLSFSPAFGLTPFNNRVLFFTTRFGTPGVWITDGTPEGTQLLKYTEHILTTTFQIGQEIFFIVADANANDTWLWKTDGTTQGTVPVKQISTTYTDSVSKTAVLNGKTYFLLFSPSQNPYPYDKQATLWSTDGSAVGTVKLKDILPISSQRYYFDATSRLLFFVLKDSSSNFILWQSDGTNAGTVSFDAGTLVSDVGFAIADRNAFYISDHYWANLNVTTGKSDGFFLLLTRIDIDQGYAQVKGRLYFNNGHLWVTGWSGLTELVGSQGYTLALGEVLFTGFSMWLFFTPSYCNSPPCGLWFTDGSPQWTVPYPNMDPILEASSPILIGSGESHLYMEAIDGANAQLWVLDAPLLPVKLHLPLVLR